MLKLDILIENLSERMGNSRQIENRILKQTIINAANDLISEFRQNVNIVEYDVESSNIIKIPNIAYVFNATFNNTTLPLIKISKATLNTISQTSLIIVDSIGVRLYPFHNQSGKLQIIGSFYIDETGENIPLSQLFQRAIIQGAILDLFILLDKPLEHIKSAKLLYNDIKDELRAQINRSQESKVIYSSNILI